MNPYPERIAELDWWLESRYNQRDRQATEALLAALLDPAVSGARHPWFVIETDAPYRQYPDEWFSFGGIADVKSLAAPRIQRERDRESMLTEWLDARDAGCPGLFVESEWRRLASVQVGHRQRTSTAYDTLMAQCLRVRVDYPKGERAARPPAERDRDRLELRRLASRVLDNSHRTVKLPPAPVPKGMYYWCELAQRLSLYARDWDALTGGLAAVVRNVCTLYNDPARAPGWNLAERLIRDGVNFSTHWIVSKAAKKELMRPWDDYRSESRALMRHWSQEIGRLKREGVIDRGRRDANGYRKHSLLNEDWRAFVEDRNMFA
jgi:hypothetical protein